MAVPVTLLVVILSLLSSAFQVTLQQRFHTATSIFVAAGALALAFCAAAAAHGVLTFRLALLVLAYLLGPAICISACRPNDRASILDMAAILLLWLPVEFGLGASLVPPPVQGRLHATAYGVAITLALILFAIYRRFSGIKYTPPQRISDLGNAAAGFACAAATLIPLGLAAGFLGRVHPPPNIGPSRLVVRIVLIFVATALPEEILFRSLVQNWLVQRFGCSNRVVGVAAVIFGASHLNNAPSTLLNWRYAIVASLSGFIFGMVFKKSTTVLSSALVHTGVNTVKYLFF